MKFYNKAKTLKSLKCKNALVPKLLIINTKDFFEKRDSTLNKVIKKFGKNDLLIVRSSSLEEDKSKKSNAGKFESIPMVYNKKHDLETAITKVLSSYKKTS